MITIACASGGSSVRLTSMLRHHARRRDRGEARRGAAGQRQGRLAAGQVDDADVAPEHAAVEAGAQRLGAGLLGGVAARVGFRAVAHGARSAARSIGGEHARDEALAEAVERALDAPDVDQVAAEADDHARAGTAGRGAQPSHVAVADVEGPADRRDRQGRQLRAPATRRKATASAMCGFLIVSLPSRSAIVRATRSTRW